MNDESEIGPLQPLPQILKVKEDGEFISWVVEGDWLIQLEQGLNHYRGIKRWGKAESHEDYAQLLLNEVQKIKQLSLDTQLAEIDNPNNPLLGMLQNPPINERGFWGEKSHLHALCKLAHSQFTSKIIQKLKQEKAVLQGGMLLLTTQNRNLSTDLASCQNNLETKNTQVQQLQAELATANQRNEALARQKAELANQKEEELRQQHETLAKQHNRVLEEKNNEVQQLQEKLATAIKRKEEFKEQYESRGQSNQNLTERNTKLHAATEQLQAQLVDVNTRNEELRQEIVTLKKDPLRVEIETIRAKNISLQKAKSTAAQERNKAYDDYEGFRKAAQAFSDFFGWAFGDTKNPAEKLKNLTETHQKVIQQVVKAEDLSETKQGIIQEVVNAKDLPEIKRGIVTDVINANPEDITKDFIDKIVAALNKFKEEVTVGRIINTAQATVSSVKENLTTVTGSWVTAVGDTYNSTKKSFENMDIFGIFSSSDKQPTPVLNRKSNEATQQTFTWKASDKP